MGDSTQTDYQVSPWWKRFSRASAWALLILNLSQYRPARTWIDIILILVGLGLLVITLYLEYFL